MTVWDRQAETCCQYLKKGSGVHVEGSLKMDTWDDKTTGEKRSKIKVQAERVQFLDRRESSGAADDEFGGRFRGPRRERPPRPPPDAPADARTAAAGQRPRPRLRATAPPPAAPRRPAPEPEPTSDEDEDIPF